MSPPAGRGTGESPRGFAGTLGPSFVLSLLLHVAAAAAGLLLPSGGGVKDSPAAPLLMVRLAAAPRLQNPAAAPLPVASRPRPSPPATPVAQVATVPTPAAAPPSFSPEPSPAAPATVVEAATPEERGPVADSLPAETIRAAAEPPIPQAVAAVFPAQPPQESPQPVESKGEGDLLSLIRARLARAISYPESARRRGLSGDLVLGLLLSPEGRIAEISLLASSGNPFLDRAVLKTLRDDGPYPYRPGLIRVPISFRLKTPS